MERIATAVRIDRPTSELLKVIGKAKGLAVNAIVSRALADYIERESLLVESDLTATLDRVRACRARPHDSKSETAAWVTAEVNYPDPAEADRIYRVDKDGIEHAVLAILDDVG